MSEREIPETFTEEIQEPKSTVPEIKLTELEKIETLRERVSIELIKLINIGSGIGHFSKDQLVGTLNPRTLILGLLAEALAEKNPSDYKSIASKRAEGSLDTARIKQYWKNDIGDEYNAGSSSVYNKPGEYFRIALLLLACLDKNGEINNGLDEYNKELIKICEQVNDKQYATQEAYDSELKSLNDLFDNIREAKVFNDRTVLEIGGSGFRGLSTISGEAKYEQFSSKLNEHDSGSDDWFAEKNKSEVHITTDNYQELLKEMQYDVTLSRGVFDMGSGVQGPHKSEEAAMSDLMVVLSKVTKRGGFSLHEGNSPAPSAQELENLGFELVITSKNVRQERKVLDIKTIELLGTESLPNNNIIEIEDNNNVYWYTWVLRKK